MLCFILLTPLLLGGLTLNTFAAGIRIYQGLKIVHFLVSLMRFPVVLQVNTAGQKPAPLVMSLTNPKPTIFFSADRKTQSSEGLNSSLAQLPGSYGVAKTR